MLDKMLDLDRSAGSQTVLDIGRISLNSAGHDAVAIAIAEGLKPHVVTNLDPALPMVSGDGTKLRQLVSILLSNAMKFSSEGSEVVVSSRADSGHVHVTVKDHGTGMPNDFDSQLFGRYRWSADNPTTKVIGTGLGLPMAREIVELHGGKNWVVHVGGRGAVVHLSHPQVAKPAAVGVGVG